MPTLDVSSAFRIAGRCSPNCTSTTAPMTWRTLPAKPVFLMATVGAFAAAAVAGAAAFLAGAAFAAGAFAGAAAFAAVFGAAFWGVAAFAIVFTLFVSCFSRDPLEGRRPSRERAYSASAPEMISINSLVICACRWRL
ncbi:hypothetical protein BQ8482_370026 [Mesorhizobium delmotii]|uniref:Uncharacterized protein n=1 Tax=Mesorhizobium delmotii TaxID=1631247 RepID=A0A2P9ARM4_9HYPH|nr:hypothetical protein BQ8482_370026 [Mesorhizobium delmotii]